MYAVIESGGKQHRVELGSEIQVDRLDVQPGDSITLDRVLLVADGDDAAVGRPVVDGATVSAQVVAQGRGQKIVVFKYKPKARTRVKQGFRAELTTLRITDIAFAGKSAAKDAEKTRKAEARQAREVEQAEKAAAAASAEQKATADKELAAKLAAAEDKPKAPRKKATTSKAADEAAAGAAEDAQPPAEDAQPPAKAAPAAEPAADATADAEPVDQDDANEKDE